MSNADWASSYAKFDKLADNFDEEEKRDDAILRENSRYEYERRQREKQMQWEDEMTAQGKDVKKLKQQLMAGRCGCYANALRMSEDMRANDAERARMEAQCKHPNHYAFNSKMPSALAQNNKPRTFGRPSKTSFNGGLPSSIDPKNLPKDPKEMLRKLMPPPKPKPKEPQLSLPEKNRRKMIAVEATQTDGNRLFKEGNYELALAVYERGCLIVNGTYGMPEDDWRKMQELEAKLDLNIALIKLKQKKWQECIDSCKMSLNIVKKNAKAHFRWAEALLGMERFEEALEQNAKALELLKEGDTTRTTAQRDRIKKSHEAYNLRGQQTDKDLARALNRKWCKKRKKEKKPKAMSSKGGSVSQEDPPAPISSSIVPSSPTTKASSEQDNGRTTNHEPVFAEE